MFPNLKNQPRGVRAVVLSHHLGLDPDPAGQVDGVEQQGGGPRRIGRSTAIVRRPTTSRGVGWAWS
ncbi:hypothetical protein GCM10009765_15530 [Fodinicola feengrottensis]|uniref:Uncharacterized protein n=1 Tax=Fodinicola feengrottensis TaxID=435914 RepID=A0ABN2G8I4_9ACTN